MVPVIRLDELGKKYLIYKHPLDRIKERFLLGRRCYHQALWALQGIRLEIQPGESVGFVGSNGAGKSTLLKLICGITRPTVGSIEVRGRVSALMELGAGFHYEFTGRENIFMNCSILGMTRPEIEQKLDRIIEFSELGEFIDRPIKIYSTGMFMRLGFSVAINTDPDILLVDEILAVGDEYFQSKCYRKIQEFREKGRTVIFVSHAVNTLRGLCQRAIWLDGGRVMADGRSVEVTDAYLNFQRQRIGRQLRLEQGDGETAPAAVDATPADGGIPEAGTAGRSGLPPRMGTREAEIHRVEILDGQGQARSIFQHGETLVIRMHFRSHSRILLPNLGVSIWRSDNVLCYGSSSAKDGTSLPELPDEGVLDFVIPGCPLLSGDYEVSVAIFCPGDIHPYDFHNRLYRFQVKCPRRDEGVAYFPHRYRYSLDGGRTILEREAHPAEPERLPGEPRGRS
jgi:ABC-type polysaccharide/polyol phosphate transport system ATPase subunit